MFLGLSRILKFGVQNFFRNVMLSIATVSVLAITLLSVDLQISLGVLGRVALSEVKSRVDVSVHFRPDVEESRVQTVKIALMALPETKDVQVVTPAEALQDFSAGYADDTAVLQSLGEVGSNPFGYTLVVRARDTKDYPKISELLESPAFAPLIEDKEEGDRAAMIAKIEDVSQKATLTGLATSAVFVFLALLIVFNTIRVSVFTRREEMTIMRLVGAGDQFIRGPFYVEAALWSGAALALSLLVLLPAVHYGQPHLVAFFGTQAADLEGFFAANWLTVFGGQYLACLFVCGVTTKLATAKYLSV